MPAPQTKSSAQATSFMRVLSPKFALASSTDRQLNAPPVGAGLSRVISASSNRTRLRLNSCCICAVLAPFRGGRGKNRTFNKRIESHRFTRNQRRSSRDFLCSPSPCCFSETPAAVTASCAKHGPDASLLQPPPWRRGDPIVRSSMRGEVNVDPHGGAGVRARAGRRPSPGSSSASRRTRWYGPLPARRFFPPGPSRPRRRRSRQSPSS